MWERQRKEEVRYLRAVEKEQRAARVAEGARVRREEKAKRDKEREEMRWVFGWLILMVESVRAGHRHQTWKNSGV